jgi:hypothetical protein
LVRRQPPATIRADRKCQVCRLDARTVSCSAKGGEGRSKYQRKPSPDGGLKPTDRPVGCAERKIRLSCSGWRCVGSSYSRQTCPDIRRGRESTVPGSVFPPIRWQCTTRRRPSCHPGTQPRSHDGGCSACYAQRPWFVFAARATLWSWPLAFLGNVYAGDYRPPSPKSRMRPT